MFACDLIESDAMDSGTFLILTAKPISLNFMSVIISVHDRVSISD